MNLVASELMEKSQNGKLLAGARHRHIFQKENSQRHLNEM